MKSYIHNEMCITVFNNGKFMIHPLGVEGLGEELSNHRPNCELNVAGGPLIEIGKNGLELEELKKTKTGLEISYFCKVYELRVITILTFIEDTNVVVQQNIVQNMGSTTQKITRFSSFFIEHIAYEKDSMWYENSELQIHLCHNKWQGEGQWRAYTPAQLGLYPSSVHAFERASYRISSIGSWSTANFYPMVVVEDKKNGNAWYGEIEGSCNWYLKLCSHGGYYNASLSMEGTCCDEGNGSWFIDLKPGEKYHSQRAFYGVAKGGFEAAAASLNAWKRMDSLVSFQKGQMPLVFNDYMDCLWFDQRPESMFPLIERAAQVGCNIFCIDGGWCANQNSGVQDDGLGDWLPNEKLYGMTSLQQVVEKMTEEGMTAGIWLELETCNRSAYGYRLGGDAVLKRYGVEIGGNKLFYNFNNEKVWNYLAKRVDVLYQMGFRYIKNDYNHSLGIGCTNNYEGNSPAEGLIQNHERFLEFIDYLREKYPDLIIENCGSGAMRSDNKTLRHFALQSTSDQENYKNNPSILMGSAAIMPPEKAGVWVYPYPTSFTNYYDFCPDMEYLEYMKDGWQTSFNMVSGLLGNMYLSGRIDLCDEYNLSLIKEGVSIYQRIKKDIAESTPIYPKGMHNINDRELTVFGLLSDTKLLLGIWNVDTQKEVEETLDLTQWLKENSKIVTMYPKRQEISVKLKETKLEIELPADNAAVFLEIII